jgi:hypothetical protein
MPRGAHARAPSPAFGSGREAGRADQILESGEVVVDGRELGRQAHPAAHGRSVADHVVAKHPCRPGVGSQQRGEQPIRRGLARPIAPEHAVVAAPRDRQVDAVERSCLPEDLGQAEGLDGAISVVRSARVVTCEELTDRRPIASIACGRSELGLAICVTSVFV